MKEHAKKALKHDTKVLGKTVPTMLIIGLFLVGGGSAALLSTFGSVSGNADVTQAVYFADGDADTVDTEVTTAFDGSLVAGQTTTTDFTLVNNATREANVELDSDASEIRGISQTVRREVYEEQTFTATAEAVDSGEVGITVTPREDEVEYVIDLPETYGNGSVTPEFSRQNGDNYQVMYYPEGSSDNYNEDGWSIRNPSTSGSKTPLNVEESNLVNYVNAEYGEDGFADSLTLRISREEGYEQTFGLNAYEEPLGNPPNNANYDTEEFDFSNTGTENHLLIDYSWSVVTETPMTDGDESVTQVTLQPNSREDFRLATDFHVALDPSPTEVDSEEDLGAGKVLDEYFSDGSYIVDLEVVPESATS
jgi:hypothetical protein